MPRGQKADVGKSIAFAESRVPRLKRWRQASLPLRNRLRQLTKLRSIDLVRRRGAPTKRARLSHQARHPVHARGVGQHGVARRGSPCRAQVVQLEGAGLLEQERDADAATQVGPEGGAGQSIAPQQQRRRRVLLRAKHFKQRRASVQVVLPVLAQLQELLRHS